MSIIRETIQLLLAPPGGLVYHLLILFSLEAMLGLAVGAWQRRRAGGADDLSGILVAATAGMLAARLVLIVVVLAGVPEALSAVRIVPPLERAIDTAVTLLLVWALLPWGRYKSLSWFFPGFGLVGVTLLFTLFLSSWQADLALDSTLVYNGSLQEITWILLQLALLSLALPGLLWRRGQEWGLQVMVLAILATGHLLQLISPDSTIHIAGWVRLAQLIAFPLLAVSIYRRLITGLSRRAYELEEVSQDSISQIAGLIYLLESTQRTIASLDIADVVERAVREVVRILKIDLCGLVLPVDGTRGLANLAAVYSSENQGSTNTVRFNLADHPALEYAIRRKKSVPIDAAAEHVQLKELYVLMGSMETGPLLIQPLMYNSTAIGALLLGNHLSQQQFSASQQKLSQALGRQVAIAIENARHYQSITLELESLRKENKDSKSSHRRIQSQLETQLQQSQEDIAHFARRLDEASGHVKREQQNVESLAEQLQNIEQENSQLNTEIDQAQKEIHSLQQRLQEQTDQALSIEASLESQLAQSNEQIFEMAARLQQRGQASLDGAIFKTLPIGLLLADKNGRVVQVNAAAGRLLAQPIERLLSKPVDKVCSDINWREGVNLLFGDQDDALKGKLDRPFTIQIKDRSIIVTWHILRDKEGIFVAALAMLDIAIATEESQKAREEFIGALSQELRTPMTSITGYTDLLLGESVGIVGEMQRKFLQRIKANIERMAAMLNDLIGVTAIDSGQLHIEPEPIEVNIAVQEAIVSARAQLEEKDLSLDLNLASDMGAIEVDPNAFQQIVGNLLSNACKASPAGSEIRITANYEIENGSPGKTRLVFSMTDSGGGIAPKDQPRVFDRFYRAEQALISGLGETGVGLSIVKALVQAHNGQVWVESKMGKGSTFAFSLPVTPLH